MTFPDRWGQPAAVRRPRCARRLTNGNLCVRALGHGSHCRSDRLAPVGWVDRGPAPVVSHRVRAGYTYRDDRHMPIPVFEHGRWRCVACPVLLTRYRCAGEVRLRHHPRGKTD